METYAEIPFSERPPILTDRMVHIGKGDKQMKQLLRLIETTDLKGKKIRIISNRFHLTAEEMGDLYRIRWKIETFFRWVKQHLKLTCLYGEAENAVWNQILICLIAYCLTLLMHLELKTTKTLLEDNRLLKSMLTKSWEAMHEMIFRKPL